MEAFLLQSLVFLAAAAIAAPIAKKLNISSVLGYLFAGVLIGPYGIGFIYEVYEVESILHFAELGVVLLLFLIGLELKPKRLWVLRGAIFGLGAGQVVLTAVALTPLLHFFGIAWLEAGFVALALSLSSTAFVLQVLEEKGELQTRHGRAAFSVLLFQDLAAIPMIAVVPLFAAGSTHKSFDAGALLEAAIAIAIVILFGKYGISRIYKLVASTGLREAMTATALLTLVGVVLLMEEVGLSAALGAFLAGALLADSDYRHQIAADIAPFEGLLLGLFFTAVGMALNFNLLTEIPGIIVIGVVMLLAVKAAVVFGIGRWRGMSTPQARRLALSISQGGEFAFVLFATAVGDGVISDKASDTLSVIVTLSMLATPLLLLIDDKLAARGTEDERPFDDLPQEQGHVVIAGFGRVGQIVARILTARDIPFTALDHSTSQVDFVARFGAKAYYGDASRIDILHAAQLDKARGFVLAVDDVEASLKIAEIVRQHFPHVPIFARARNRRHAHELMALGITTFRRETFLASVDLARLTLIGIGFDEKDAEETVEAFKVVDQRRLREDFEYFTDDEKMRLQARKYTEELEEMFHRDQTERDEKPQG